MAWTPASSSTTVPDPCGRVAAFSVNSAYNWSKVFTRSRLRGARARTRHRPPHGPLKRPAADGSRPGADSDDLELIEFARTIIEMSTYGEDGCPHDGGCSAGSRREDGGGVNIFHLTGGPGAELVARGHARACSVRELSAIVTVGHRRRPVHGVGTARCALTTT